MIVIGVAGESGTGKSTIAAHLGRLGAAHIDADRIAHEILRHDGRVREEVRNRFGASVFVDGEIDRKALGEVAFGSGAALRALNAIIHPPIVAALRQKLTNLEGAGAALVVVDAALLLEVDVPFKMDLMIALRCNRKEQVRRLHAKDGGNMKEIQTRLERQAHLQKSFYKADVVVDTTRERSKVLAEVEDLVKGLLGHSVD
jgi:dephospho-CoA kinase